MRNRRASKSVCGCVIGVAVAVVVMGSFALAAATGHVFAIVISAIIVIVVAAALIAYLRFRVAESYYEVILPEDPDDLQLGGRIVWGPSLQCNKQCRMGAPTISLQCREHAINRAGTSDSHYYNEVSRQEFVVGEPRTLHAGEIVEFGLRGEIPATGIPSYHGGNNTMQWRAMLNVPMPGFVPDISREVTLSCMPEIAPGADRGISTRDAIPQTWVSQVKEPKARAEHGSVTARIEARDAHTVGSLYAVPVGERIRLRVTVQTTKDIHCRAVLCWVGCRVHGSGSEDAIAVMDWFPIQEGDFREGAALTRDLDITIPETGPVSYQGKYIKMDWMVRVRVDVPVWRDVWLELPFIVTPRLSEESS